MRSLSLRRSEVFRLEKLGRRGEGGLRRSFGVEEFDEDDDLDAEGIVILAHGLLLLLVLRLLGDRGILRLSLEVAGAYTQLCFNESKVVKSSILRLRSRFCR